MTDADPLVEAVHAAALEVFPAAGLGRRTSQSLADALRHHPAVRAYVATIEADRDKWKRHADGFAQEAARNLARAEAAEAKVARVQALPLWQTPALGWVARRSDLRAALADPEVTNG